MSKTFEIRKPLLYQSDNINKYKNNNMICDYNECNFLTKIPPVIQKNILNCDTYPFNKLSIMSPVYSNENIHNINLVNQVTTQPVGSFTEEDADQLYLSKTKNDISTANTTTFNGEVNINGSLTQGVSGITSSLNTYGSIKLYDNITPYTSFSKIYSSGADLMYESPTGINTTHKFSIYNASSTLSSAFEVTPFQNISRFILTLTNRLNFSVSSYSFPFTSNTHLGYYVKQTGSEVTNISTNTYTSILTASPQIEKGVWRIDWSVKTTVLSGGTITADHSLVSVTSANTNTPASFTGSQIKNHTSQNYSAGDIQIINGSFTLNLTASTTLYLTINRVFSSGSYSFIGEIGATRIA